MANAIAFIDAKGQPDADSFYEKFSWEPVLPSGSICVGSRELLYSINVADLLAALAKGGKAAQDVLLVCHGTKLGPSIPLVKNSDAYLQKNALDVLFGYEDKKISSDDATAKLRFSTTGELIDFVNKVKAVRGLKLNRLELRACEIGGNKDTLRLLKRFFGCSSVCAPKNFDVFGTIDANKLGPTAIETLRKQYKDAKITGEPPNRFGLYVGLLMKFHAAAESQTAITNWAKTYMPQPGSQITESSFPVHGITSQPERIVWAGEQKYRTLLEKI